MLVFWSERDDRRKLDKVLTVERQILKSVPQVLEAVREIEREAEHRVKPPADQLHTKMD
jgi:hypothetical protein